MVYLEIQISLNQSIQLITFNYEVWK